MGRKLGILDNEFAADVHHGRGDLAVSRSDSVEDHLAVLADVDALAGSEVELGKLTGDGQSAECALLVGGSDVDVTSHIDAGTGSDGEIGTRGGSGCVVVADVERTLAGRLEASGEDAALAGEVQSRGVADGDGCVSIGNQLAGDIHLGGILDGNLAVNSKITADIGGRAIADLQSAAADIVLLNEEVVGNIEFSIRAVDIKDEAVRAEVGTEGIGDLRVDRNRNEQVGSVGVEGTVDFESSIVVGPEVAVGVKDCALGDLTAGELGSTIDFESSGNEVFGSPERGVTVDGGLAAADDEVAILAELDSAGVDSGIIGDCPDAVRIAPDIFAVGVFALVDISDVDTALGDLGAVDGDGAVKVEVTVSGDLVSGQSRINDVDFGAVVQGSGSDCRTVRSVDEVAVVNGSGVQFCAVENDSAVLIDVDASGGDNTAVGGGEIAADTESIDRKAGVIQSYIGVVNCS